MPNKNQSSPTSVPKPLSNSSLEFRKNFLLQESLHIQSLHLLSNLFPLSEIVVQPEILPPPIQISPDSNNYDDSIVHQVLPYMPDWPDFMSPYTVKHVKVGDILRGGMDIALIGKPGIGKTTALAYFTMLLINSDPDVGYLKNSLPIFLHARDIIETLSINDPNQALIKILGEYYQDLKLDKIRQMLDTAFQSNEIILLIDGIDELPRNFIKECYSFIQKLRTSRNSRFKLVITAPLDYLDGFILDNVSPMALGLWNQNKIKDFIDLLVSNYLNIQKTGKDDTAKDLLISSLKSWLINGINQRTPLEITIQLITILSGVETGKSSFEIMKSFIEFLIPNKTMRNSLEVLAYQTLISENPIINKYEMNHYAPELVASDPNSFGSVETIDPKKALSLKSHGIFLEETINGNTIFAHPLYLGFLASNAVIRNGQYQSIFDQKEWAGKETALGYLTHVIDISQYIDYHDIDNDSPLHTKLFNTAQWLRESKSTSIWRPQILKRLAQILNTESLPTTIRGKALAALCCSNDKGIPNMLRGYLQSGYPAIRLLAALGCGFLQDVKSINDLADLLADQNSPVRTAACMALFAMNREDTLEFIVKILMQADENLRRTSAEVLTLEIPEGHSVLADGISHQDILVRRAVVFGLGLLRNKWAYEQLQQMQIQEGQWVVRTAATQALEQAEGLDPCIPSRLVAPQNCSWLIHAASNTGEGISPGIPPIPLLLKLLDNGTNEEKLGSLDYLSGNITESVIARIYDVMFNNEDLVREAAYYSLWKISLAGVEMPSAKKFGFQ